MNDYDRIAKVIHYLDACRREQPDLETVARLLGLSPFHFHRLFRKWAGITPKAFLQCLTLQEAKEALRQGCTVLDAALDAGLSGPGRLHDLCVKLEAATPGEIKSGGADLTIEYGTGDTPFGRCLLGITQRGICHLAFLDEAGEAPALSHLRKLWPRARLARNDQRAASHLSRAFQLDRSKAGKPIDAWVRGTEFQINVWRALLTLPHGCLTSYGEIARHIGQPSAARAVGAAVGSNPIAYLIPCHRVIRQSGVIGDYRWGHGRKRTLIAWERALSQSAV